MRPKVAYWVNSAALPAATALDGTSSDIATQLWETGLVPTSSKLSEDHINVGVWKSDGVITTSTKGTTSYSYTSTAYGTDEGTVYGNGTANPFLGYAITNGSTGYIETAQMQ